MSMKWGEIQVITLQKLFATDDEMTFDNLEELQKNDDCKAYIEGMIPVANEAIQLIKPYIMNMYEYDSEQKKYVKTKIEVIDNEYTKNTELSLPYDACVLIPLYMASQLMKDDDISLATQYRNEFEVGLQNLIYNIENQTEINNVLY